MVGEEIFFVYRVNEKVGDIGARDYIINLDVGATFCDVYPGLWRPIVVHCDLCRDGEGSIKALKVHVELFTITIEFCFLGMWED